MKEEAAMTSTNTQNESIREKFATGIPINNWIVFDKIFNGVRQL